MGVAFCDFKIRTMCSSAQEVSEPILCMYVTYQFVCLFVVDIFLSFSVIFVCFTHCCSDHYSWLSVSIIVQKV